MIIYIFMKIFSDYRKADSECDDGSSIQRNKVLPPMSGHQTENIVNFAHLIEGLTKSSKSNGTKQGGGRRKAQSRSKNTVMSSQGISISVISDDDSDAENGLHGIDKSAKNNRRKRKEREKVLMEIYDSLSVIFMTLLKYVLMCITFSFFFQAKYYGLTSLCIVSHFQFFSKFRECLEVLRQLLDAVVPCSMGRSLCNKCNHHVSPINVRKSPSKPSRRRKLHSSWYVLGNSYLLQVVYYYCVSE